MSAWVFPVGCLPIVWGLILPFVPGRIRPWWALSAPLLVLFFCFNWEPGLTAKIEFEAFAIYPLHFDAWGRWFAIVFAGVLFAGMLYGAWKNKVSENSFVLIYAGSAINTVLAGDWISLLVFWEIMALSSAILIMLGNHPDSRNAGLRYLMIHLLGGFLLMSGIAAHIHQNQGMTLIQAIDADCWSDYFILAGLLINAGAPPLSVWIADSYPKASPNITVFLSAFTTKTAVLVLARVFAGEFALIPIGAYMIIYGIVYAMRANELRLLLVYSIVGQVGIMLMGIGVGTPEAMAGVALHALSHISYKALLLMSAATVIATTGTERMDQLGGLGKILPWSAALALCGSLTLSGMPGTAGFVSKSLLMEAAVSEQAWIVEFMLTVAGSLSLLYVGLRYPWFIFFKPAQATRPIRKAISSQQMTAMLLLAMVCLVLGLFPGIIEPWLPAATTLGHVYSLEHVADQLVNLLIGAAAFFMTLRWLKPHSGSWYDIDWLYRSACAWCWLHLNQSGVKLDYWVQHLKKQRNNLIKIEPQGIVSRNWPTGSMVLWVAILLLCYLFFSY